MRLYLDERCLVTANLSVLLRAWYAIADLVALANPALSLFVDKRVVSSPDFLREFNRQLRTDERTLLRLLIFGSGRLEDWSASQLGAGISCRLLTEEIAVRDCGVCEAYGHRSTSETTALLGGHNSSFADRRLVGIERLEPPTTPLEVECGTSVDDVVRIGTSWGCLPLRYDLNAARSPRDDETILSQAPQRFERIGKFERKGRRNVYREMATGNLYYVDDLHTGGAAHLEVFDARGDHLGTASLDGVINQSSAVQGRVISW